MRTPIHHSLQFKVTLMALLLAALLAAGSGMPDRAIAAPMQGIGFAGCANPSEQVEIPEAECDALVALYNSAAGASWYTNTDWLQTTTPCSWYGVTCFEEHVNMLMLSSNNLTGTIPTEIAALTSLQTLNIRSNNLTGGIPAEIGSLTSLLYLYLYENSLGGPIPTEMGNLTNLDTLYMYSNGLTGVLPVELADNTLLTQLRVDDNNLVGIVPFQFGALSGMTRFHLNDNMFTGPLPQSFTNLTSMDYFYYQNTNLCAPDNVPFQTWLTGIANKTTSGYNCAAIFADGFESGDTSAWSSTVEGPVEMGGLFSGPYIPPGLGLIVHPLAAVEGSYGLGAIVEDNHPMFVQDDTPSAEAYYHASFSLQVKTLTADPNKGMGILLGSGTGKSFQVFTGWDGAQHVVVARVGEDDKSWTWTSFYAVPTNAWFSVDIYWSAATGDGNNDGFFELYLGGVLQETLSVLDNDTVRVDTVRMGPFYVSPSATGIIGFDVFTSDGITPEP